VLAAVVVDNAEHFSFAWGRSDNLLIDSSGSDDVFNRDAGRFSRADGGTGARGRRCCCCRAASAAPPPPPPSPLRRCSLTANL
jgi:hypothetical protein